MSLFGSLMREMENDPIFGHHHRQMNRMVNSFFGGQGGLFGGGGFGNSLMGPSHMDSHAMMPFGGGFGSPFGGLGIGGNMFDMSQGMMSDPNSHSFSSSTVMSVSSGADGRPQVYQASSAMRQGPGGIKETRKTVQDSRSGLKKMEVGRHLGERGHIREKEENMFTGQREENEDFINLDESEAERFNQEWRQRASYPNGYGHGGQGYLQHHSHNSPNLALTSGRHHDEEPHPAYNHHSRRHGGHGQRSSNYDANPPSASAVTIEELPASDNEGEVAEPEAEKQPTTSRLSFPSIPRVTRRSPHSKERRQKSTSKRSKKY